MNCFGLIGSAASNRLTPTSMQLINLTLFALLFRRSETSRHCDAVISSGNSDAITADLTKPFGTYLALDRQEPWRQTAENDYSMDIDVKTSVVFGSAVTGITQGIIPTLLRDNVGPNPANFRSTSPIWVNHVKRYVSTSTVPVSAD
jgi:hypothetical protein